MKNPFRLSEEEKKIRQQERKAYQEGLAQAEEERVKRRIERAHERGLEKGRRGKWATVKQIGSIAGKVVDECGKFTENLEKQSGKLDNIFSLEEPKKKRRKRQ